MLRILPFNALRTLEAVVRQRGFGRAASELNISQSAVSQHVKHLEEWLGVQLLHRRGRQSLPTPAGERLAQSIRDGFGKVQFVCDDLRGSGKSGDSDLIVGAPPGFAFLWLMPRLLRFDDAHPEISVSLSTDKRARDPEFGEADVFVAYSPGGFPAFHAERLMSESMSPVCAPALAETLETPQDLARFTILQDDLETVGAGSNWDFWARECGIVLPRFDKIRQYGQANLVVQAAIQGLGVAMGRGPLVADAVADGRLVRPFEQVAQSQFGYWLVCRHDLLSAEPVRAFTDWLHAEADAFVAAT